MSPRSAVVLVNADFESRDAECTGDGPHSYAADAAVLDTARAIADTLRGLGLATSELRVTTDLAGARDALLQERPDVVFNLVESLDNDYGREWEVPAMLASAGLAYTGNGPTPLLLCRSKDEARSSLERAQVRVPNAFVLHGVADLASIPSDVFPLFLKPARVDGSIGIDAQSVCHDARALRTKFDALHASLPGPFLAERFLPGKELNVAIFPEPERGRLVVTEIDFSPVPAHLPRFVTYDSKWDPASPEYASKSVPAQIDATLHREVSDQARRAFLALGGSGYGRVDLRLDDAGTPHVIDVNPNNDLHPEAGLARAAASVGVTYPALISGILEHALGRHRAI